MVSNHPGIFFWDYKGLFVVYANKKFCHPERSAEHEVEGSSHFVYIGKKIGAKILRLRCAAHSFAQNDIPFLLYKY